MQRLVRSHINSTIISVHKRIIGLIYLILFDLINIQCYGFERNGLCGLEIPRFANICDRSDNIVRASETESDCQVGAKCWCIIIDNQNRVYDGAVVIELVQMFNNDNFVRISDNSYRKEIQFSQLKSYYTYNGIVPGMNHIFLHQYIPLGALTNITSIKVHNNEICKFGANEHTPNSFVKYPNFQQPPTNDRVNYDYFYDCMNRIDYTDSSTKYCTTYRPEFMIEKRFTLDHRLYWCIVINNDNYALTSANRLHIEYSSPNRNYVYYPLNAYTERGVHGSDYQLGNPRTVIAISENYNQLANLNSITIDNQPICSYFDASVTTVSPFQIYPFTHKQDEPPTSLIPVTQRTEPTTPVSTQTFIDTKPCGVRPIQPVPLISFGSNTKPGDWPWHAAIYKVKLRTTKPNFICGGTLINRKTIVTAAHCVIEFNSLVVIPERLTVELGRYDLDHVVSTVQEYNVFEVKPHEHYNLNSFQNDIALLILANYVKESLNVNFICLPSPDAVLRKEVGTAVGWGTDSNSNLQNELKEAPFLVVDDITCLESNREFFGQFLTTTNFCAGYRNNTNVCRGDSGGGLVFMNNNQWFLGGITSIGVSMKSVEHQCDITQYVLFTDVTKFLPWIKIYS